MTRAIIPSLDNPDHKLMIESRPSNDMVFATASNAPALARLGIASLFSSYKTDQHLQSILMEVSKAAWREEYPLQGAPYTLLSDGPITVVTFRTDNPEVDAAVMKTTDNIVGIHTFYNNGRDVVENAPVVWLGQCDLDNQASRHLEKLYAQCVDDLCPAFYKRGKARMDLRSIVDVEKPLALER